MRLASCFALVAALAGPAAADETTRAAYAQGFWDGFATARQAAVAGRGSRSPLGLSDDAVGAPVWILPAAGDAAGQPRGLVVPADFAATAGSRAIYFKGPWVWLVPDATALFVDGVLARDAVDRSESLTDAPALEPPVTERIRAMRSMGINEGVVLVRLPLGQ
jgi:hypothetical protein